MFFSLKWSLFHNSNLFGPCIIHILYTVCAKIKKSNSGPKRLILSSHLRLGLPNVLFPSGFPTKTLAPLYPPPYAPHALPISFVSILPPVRYWVRSTDHSCSSLCSFLHSPTVTSAKSISVREVPSWPYLHANVAKISECVSWSPLRMDRNCSRARCLALHCCSSFLGITNLFHAIGSKS